MECVRCNLCGADDYAVLHEATIKPGEELTPEELACTNIGHGRHYRIVRCNGCGLIYSNPRDNTASIEQCYALSKDTAYELVADGREKAFKRSLAYLEKFGKGKLMDIGCSCGLFVKLALDKGWDAYGIEPSAWAVSVTDGRLRNRIRSAGIDDISAMAEKFNFVTMWDVLEHLYDPINALRSCRARIFNNGILALSTMRCRGLFYLLCGSRWPWFMRMHLYYFTPETISAMLNKCGFRIIHIRPYVHYVSLKYLVYKTGKTRWNLGLSGANKFMERIILPVRLGDFMEVYAQAK